MNLINFVRADVYIFCVAYKHLWSVQSILLDSTLSSLLDYVFKLTASVVQFGSFDFLPVVLQHGEFNGLEAEPKLLLFFTG